MAIFARALVLAALAGVAYASGGVDMSKEFAKLKTCGVCIKAGYGWCPIKRRCGGFANKECGIGPNYVADDYLKPKAAQKPRSPPSGGGTDMSATFAKLRDCASCTGAGWGWCPMQRKCGGFANKECGIGPNYVAADAAPSIAGAPRNGHWQSSKNKPVEAPPTSKVPAASPPPPASLLYAGPVATPEVASAAVSPTGDVSPTIAAAHLANSTEPLEESELMRLPTEALVGRILQLQSAISALTK
jgi:hypothetical protein